MDAIHKPVSLLQNNINPAKVPIASVEPGSVPNRVACYIDGYNLYYGIRELKDAKLKWLDVKRLASSCLKEGQWLEQVCFFTSRVKNGREQQRRQNIYLEAIEASGVVLVEGRYQNDQTTCRKCGNTWSSPHEKKTDVNIATHLIVDAYQDKYDTALLISGDSDLVPPIEAVRTLFPDKRVVVGFPPKRSHQELRDAASGYFSIGKDKLLASQLPEEVVNSVGYTLRRPAAWM